MWHISHWHLLTRLAVAAAYRRWSGARRLRTWIRKSKRRLRNCVCTAKTSHSCGARKPTGCGGRHPPTCSSSTVQGMPPLTRSHCSPYYVPPPSLCSAVTYISIAALPPGAGPGRCSTDVPRTKHFTRSARGWRSSDRGTGFPGRLAGCRGFPAAACALMAPEADGRGAARAIGAFNTAHGSLGVCVDHCLIPERVS